MEQSFTSYEEDWNGLQQYTACLSRLVGYFLLAHLIQKPCIYLDLKKLHLEKGKVLILIGSKSIILRIENGKWSKLNGIYFLDNSSGIASDVGGNGHSPPGALGSPSSGDQGMGATGSSDGSWMGYISNAVSASAAYLPSQVTDTLLQGRAFATVHHNLYGLRNICALAV